MERSEILRRIRAVEEYKKKIVRYVEDLKNQYYNNKIDKRTYEHKISEVIDGKSSLQWIGYYDNLLNEYNRKLYSLEYYPEEDKKINIHLIISVLILLGIFFFAFFKPSITGLYTGLPVSTYEDGYKVEGNKWVEIRGEKLYERCLKINSEIDFNEVDIIGKVTSASGENDLRFVLYKSDVMNNQPGLEVGSCKVNNYEDIWKSCAINGLNNEKGDYWICASYPEGDYSKTYFTLAYQNGDNGRTAFWTGQNWQKLDRNSYTLKGVFKKYGK